MRGSPKGRHTGQHLRAERERERNGDTLIPPDKCMRRKPYPRRHQAVMARAILIERSGVTSSSTSADHWQVGTR